MNSKVRVLAIIVLSLAASTLPTLTPARADLAPAPGNPRTQWVPAGPIADKLRFQVYSDATAEFNDFQSTTLGTGLDIADALVPQVLLDGFQTNPRFLLTTPVQQYNVYGLDFNMNHTFWGVSFRNGDEPLIRLGINIRQGIAHLISKSGFITSVLAGKGDRADCFTPKLQIINSGILCPLPSDPSIPFNGNIPSWDVCSWDPLFPSANYPSCQSAYNFGSQSDTTGAVLSGPDFCAAADHFIAAGLATGKDAGCALTGLSSAAQTQTVYLSVPFKESGRRVRALGDAFTTAINALMANRPARIGIFANPPAVVECGAIDSPEDAVPGADSHFAAPDATGSPTSYSDILEGLGKATFQDVSALCPNWDMAAIGWGLSQTIDQFYGIYNSKFSFNSYSNPNFDHWSSMIEFNSTLSMAQKSAQSAEYIMGAAAVNIPVWSDAGRFAYLNGWTNVVNWQGAGTSNWWTSLNAWNQAPPSRDVNGNSVLRWGLQESTVRLNVYTSLSFWDRLVLSEIYDTLLASNPYSPNDLFGWMANQYQILTPQPGDPAGTKSDIQFSLRPDILFHDGAQVTPNDVKFSLLTLTTASFGSVIDVLDVTILGPSVFRVNLGHLSPFALNNVGSIPIIPQHIWASDPTRPCATKGSAQCTVNTNFVNGPVSDPVINHRLIGSGAWMCVSLQDGSIGGGCVTPSGGTPGTGTAATGPGDTILLQRSDASAFVNGVPTPTGGGLDSNAYFRTPAKYLQWQWADIFGHGTVDLIDFASAKGCTNQPASTTGCSHWDTRGATITCTTAAGSCTTSSTAPFGGNNDGTVNVGEVAQVGAWSGISWTFGITYVINHSTGVTSLPTGAQAIPQTIYEGGVTYIAENTP